MIIALVMSVPAARAFDLKDALQNVAGAAAGENSSKGDGLSGIAGAIGALLGKTDVTQKDLIGTWKYAKPAIAFQSDNLLQKAGGAAAAGVIENKIANYYKIAGMEALQIKFEEDSTFTFTVKKIVLKGTLEKADDGNFIFNFKALGKINLGKMHAAISKNGNNINLTFDVSKLLNLVSKVASVTGNSTISGLSKLLNSYDGMRAGFELSKTADATK